MDNTFFVKKFQALYPYSEEAEELLRSIAQGEIVEVRVHKSRNLQHHKKLWAIVSEVWKHADHAKYPTKDVLMDALKLATGHYAISHLHLGAEVYEYRKPASIAFHKMDQVQFNAFYDRVMDWIAANVIEGMEPSELRRELEIMVDSGVGAA